MWFGVAWLALLTGFITWALWCATAGGKRAPLCVAGRCAGVPPCWAPPAKTTLKKKAPPAKTTLKKKDGKKR